MPEFKHKWSSDPYFYELAGCSCDKCSIRQFLKRIKASINRLGSFIRNSFVYGCDVALVGSEILIGKKMVKPFNFRDVRACVKAMKGFDEVFIATCNYHADHLRELQKEGNYEVKTLDFLHQYWLYWNKKATVHNTKMVEKSRSFENARHYEEILTIFNTHAKGSLNHLSSLRRLHKELRLRWTPAGREFAVRFSILAGLNARIKNYEYTEMNIQWSQYYNSFIYALKNTTFIDNVGFIKNQDLADKFIQCHICTNYIETFRVHRYFNEEHGVEQLLCTRCVRNLPKMNEPIKEHNDDVLNYLEGFLKRSNEKATSRTMYLGIELEVYPSDLGIKKFETKHKLARHCNLLLVKKNKMAFIKRDGSIEPKDARGNTDKTKGGFEIVSVPATHAWHTQEGWEQFFDKEEGIAKYLSGWNHTDCGMHIHVSRAALGTSQIGKIIYFVNEDKNRLFIEDIAGRGKNKFCQLIKKDLKKTIDGVDAGYIPNMAEGHYNAVWIHPHKPTIEFRIFRSNVSRFGFMKNVDFAVAVCAYCSEASNQDLDNHKAFVEFIDKNRAIYKHLTVWMVKKGYLKEKHRFNPEFQEEIILEA